jgi:hypothetical protein
MIPWGLGVGGAKNIIPKGLVAEMAIASSCDARVNNE